MAIPTELDLKIYEAMKEHGLPDIGNIAPIFVHTPHFVLVSKENAPHSIVKHKNVYAAHVECFTILAMEPREGDFSFQVVRW